MQAMAPTLFMLYVSRDVDWLDGHNVMVLRLLFAGSIVLQLAAGLLVWLRVRAAADRRPVALPPASAEAPPVNTTVHDFDVAEVRKLAQSVVGNAAFLAFLNYKFDMAMPIYFQVFMGLFRIYDWEMFRIHVLGVRERERDDVSCSVSHYHQDTAEEYPILKRPFPAPPSPFAGLMSAFNPPAEEPEAPAAAAVVAGAGGAEGNGARVEVLEEEAVVDEEPKKTK
jgi:hypothetical protein